MHDLYIAEIYRSRVIFLLLTVYVYLNLLRTRRAPEKSDIV